MDAITSARLRFQRLAGACGVAAPVTSLTLIFAAVSVSPWFSWQQNALSDMGVSATPNPFNFGLVLDGLFNLVFTIGILRQMDRSRLARLGSLALLLGAIALPLIGIITEDQHPWHWPISASYFFFTPLAYLFIGTWSFRRGRKTDGCLTLAAGIAALLVIFLRDPLTHQDGIAVPEILAALIIGCWTFSMGIRLLLQPATDKVAI